MKTFKWLIATKIGRICLGGAMMLLGSMLSWDSVIGVAIRGWDNYDPDKTDGWAILALVGAAIFTLQIVYWGLAALWVNAIAPLFKGGKP